MKFSLATSSLLLSLATANEVFVSDPGDGLAVLLEEQVPNVLGSPWGEDPPIKVHSQVPVSVLRYSDYPEFFLEGGQALYPSEMYVIVKSECGDDATLIPQVEYGNFTRSMDWDTGEYTGEINITFPDAEEDAIDTEAVLEPSIFTALWNYGSFWCQAGPVTAVPTIIEEETVDPRPTDVPLDDTAALPEVSLTDATRPPRTSAPSSTDAAMTPPPSAIPNRTAALQNAGSSAFSAKTVVSLVMTLLSGVFMLLNVGGGARGSRSFLMVTMMLVTMILLGTIFSSPSSGVTHAQSPAKNGQRKLQECAVSVEILLDGCRRVDQTDDTDLLVTAPSVMIYDGEVMDMNTTANPDDECVTDYEGDLVFTLSEINEVAVVERQQSLVVAVPSFRAGDSESGFTDDRYGACFRAVEGRPYVDSNGRHVHASAVRETNVAWSASTESHEFEQDKELGKQWLDRAVGEHASVPAFAAFTIALMSNNAPPQLVKDALSAAQDEVRHAETSFEVASLLMGETVEPGPLPPSSLSFGQDITALALAAAKEGCVDETLSALVAGLEVDHQIDQHAQLSDATKAVLKEKMQLIALEETTHSALAWRTVQWACEIDEKACKAVEDDILNSEYFERAFSKRFGIFNGHVLTLAKEVWNEVHSTLTPIVLGKQVKTQELDLLFPCLDGEVLSERENMSTLKEMGLRIISQLTCSS